jgi:hypothetical protein
MCPLSRDAKLVQMRLNNPEMTLESIGIHFGITRERARQILVRNGAATRRHLEYCFCSKCGARHKSSHSKEIRLCSECKYHAIRGTYTCYQCGTDFVRKKSEQTRRHQTGLDFCSRQCYGRYCGKNYGWASHRNQILLNLEISPDDSEFAQALKKYVKENKVTLSWIAKRIGVSPRSVSKWMSSQNIPTERSAAKLRAIGIDPSA